MGKVHADNIETGTTEVVDGLDRVCLRTDSADNGGPAHVVLGCIGSIKSGEPLDLVAKVKMVEGVGRDGLSSLVGQHCE